MNFFLAGLLIRVNLIRSLEAVVSPPRDCKCHQEKYGGGDRNYQIDYYKDFQHSVSFSVMLEITG